MERKFKITVEGRQYNVTVEELTGQNSVPHEPGAIFLPPTAHAQSFAPGNSNHAPAHLATAPVARAPAEAGDVVCTLNGVVESVLVTIGQQVSAGDRLLVVEAMKMKTPIVTGGAGKVAAILVNVGDGVETGQVLVKLA